MALTYQPSGEIYLLSNVGLDNTYQNTFDFKDRTAQTNFFKAKAVKNVLTGYSYLRKNSAIRVPFEYDDIFSVSYVMYRNAATGKWIYCFVTGKQYIAKGLTELIIETDVMQTYLFDYKIRPSFVDREHQDRWGLDGKPIFNMVEENLGYGDEYVKEYELDVNPYSGMLFFLLVASDPIEAAGATAPEPIQSAPTPFHYYIIPYRADLAYIRDGSGTTVMDAQDLCRLLSEDMKVLSVSLLPYIPFGVSISGDQVTIGGCTTVSYTWNDGQSSIGMIKITGAADDGKQLLVTMDKFAGITFPTNFKKGNNRDYQYETKLMTFPYSYYQITDHQAEPTVVKTEYLTGDQIKLWVTQVISHSPKTKYFVEGYLGESDGKKHCMINSTVNDLPLKSDAYKNYMMANKSSVVSGLATAAVGSAAAIGIGIATGGVGAAVVGGAVLSNVSSVVSELAKQKDLKNVPDGIRNYGNNISFDIADGNTRVKIIRYGITEKYKKVLADYWSMYGYKCNEIKVPDLKSRRNYNYIKMIGANIEGNMDIIDLTTIKKVFDTGVTFWHYNPSDDDGSPNYTPMKSGYSKENPEKSIYQYLYGPDGSGDTSNPNIPDDVPDDPYDPQLGDLIVTFNAPNDLYIPIQLDAIQYNRAVIGYKNDNSKAFAVFTNETGLKQVDQIADTYKQICAAHNIANPPPIIGKTCFIEAPGFNFIYQNMTTFFLERTAVNSTPPPTMAYTKTDWTGGTLYIYNPDGSLYLQRTSGGTNQYEVGVLFTTFPIYLNSATANGTFKNALVYNMTQGTIGKQLPYVDFFYSYKDEAGTVHMVGSWDNTMDQATINELLNNDTSRLWFTGSFDLLDNWITTDKLHHQNANMLLLRNNDEVDLTDGTISHDNGMSVNWMDGLVGEG